MTAEVLDCGLKLKVIYPPSYKEVEMVSTYHQLPPKGDQKEHEFTESDLV
jgi:hypothetical protein